MNAVSPTPPLPLSAELARLRAALAERPATVREAIDLLEGRAFELLIVLFVLPFLLPVSVPGMSTPLGLAIAAIAGQRALGRWPWLPEWLLQRRVPPGFFDKVIAVTHGVVRFLERGLRPRWFALTANRWICGAHYGAMVIAALLLALPLLVPLTNTLPGWTILLLATGLMERDGRVVLAGYVALVVTALWFYGVSEAIEHSLKMVWARWGA